MPLNESRFINKANPSLAEAHQSTSRPTKQEVLAAAGMAPGPAGMAADLMSAALYAKEGDWKNTLWSLASFIPLAGMAAGAKRLRSIQKLKNQRHTIETLERHKMSKEGAAALKRIKTELNTYVDIQRPKKVNNMTNAGVKNAGNNPKVREVDRKKFADFEKRIDDVAKGEGGQIEIVSGKKKALNETKFTSELTAEEKKLIKTIREEKKLYRELGGLQRGTRRSGKID